MSTTDIDKGRVLRPIPPLVADMARETSGGTSICEVRR